MTFTPSLQALIGAHTSVTSGNTQCAVDWTRNRVFIGDSVNISRMGLITGVEEIYTASPAHGGPPPIALDGNGDVYVYHPPDFTRGGIEKFSGTGLSILADGGYPAPLLGGTAMMAISTPGGQVVVDTNLVTTHAIFSIDTVYQTSFSYLAYGTTALLSPGKIGSNKIYMLVTNTDIGYVIELGCYPLFTFTLIATITPTDVDATWTHLGIDGICVDQTDGNLIFTSNNADSGAAKRNALFKIDNSIGSVTWASSVPPSTPTGIGVIGSTRQLGYSLIRSQRLAIFTGSHFGSPPNTVTIFNTSDGSVVDTYTTNINGISLFYQCYNDAIGGIVCNIVKTNIAGGPTLLNSTPSAFTGWAVLYVAAPPPAPVGNRRFLSESGPIRIIP